MKEKDYKKWALASEVVGVFFCAMGAWMGSEVVDGSELVGLTLLIVSQATLPTLGVGLLLIVAGRTLRAVLDNSN
ncbi:MAG: hypothetical protein CMJ89_09230 [Planctomycetes bacterium]|nr:hypothetical protein [Planctomycetota bacterium]